LKTISVIFGTRPEAIKLLPVILAFKDHPNLKPHICVTAQHRELLDQVLSLFEIVPDADLNLMQPNQDLTSLTSLALREISSYLEKQRPELVMVQGDTTSTFCAALSAYYHQIPVAHVEAGLRTWNRTSPYPEELNRVLTTHLADYHFAPTEWAKENLIREGVPTNRIFVTGNTVVDALQLVVEKVRREAIVIAGLPKELMNGNSSRPLVLITSHRRENFGQGLQSICDAIVALARRFSETAFVYPVHLNPNVREPVFRMLSGLNNVFLLEPLSYVDFVALLDRCKFILSDSGGIQEEAPSLGKQVLVMRNTTERPEAVEAGTALLVGTDVDKIVREAERLLSDDPSPASSLKNNPFGDGKASHRILEIIANKLEGN
jgi:UDP-N-acetylglucosamine 2-epimerase (non-hydrolysing)